MKNSLAMAYQMKNRGEKKARGGMMKCAHGSMNCEMCHGGKMMAEGGFVHEEKSSGYRSMPKEHMKGNEHAEMEDHRMLNQHGEDEEGADSEFEDDQPEHERMYSHKEENQGFPHEEEDMVSRIMRQKQHHYSKGGRVANDTPIRADYNDNDFDDLVKDDDLEEHYTGANSGDEIGNDQEDEDRHDIVKRIMKSRRLKDRMPHPM